MATLFSTTPAPTAARISLASTRPAALPTTDAALERNMLSRGGVKKRKKSYAKPMGCNLQQSPRRVGTAVLPDAGRWSSAG